MRGSTRELITCCLVGFTLACGATPSVDPQDTHNETAEPDALLLDTSGPEEPLDTSEAETGASADTLEDIAPTTPDVTQSDGQGTDVIVDTTDTDLTLDTATDITLDVAEVDTAPELTSLIDNNAWTLVTEAADPFLSGDQSPTDPCPESEIQAENTPDGVWLDVSTEVCAWVTLQQPLLHPVSPGDQVQITVVHFEVYAGETDYTLTVAMGEAAETLWTKTVPLGSGFELIEETVAVPGDHVVGVPIWYHISNHGENTWSLVGIDLLGP